MHAVSVCDNAAYFHGHINEMLKALGLEEQVSSEEIINIIDGYKGRGYALNTSEELFLFKEIARTSGVPVDPVYTGKGKGWSWKGKGELCLSRILTRKRH